MSAPFPPPSHPERILRVQGIKPPPLLASNLSFPRGPVLASVAAPSHGVPRVSECPGTLSRSNNISGADSPPKSAISAILRLRWGDSPKLCVKNSPRKAPLSVHISEASACWPSVFRLRNSGGFFDDDLDRFLEDDAEVLAFV